jgi:hypothetical protein
MTTPPIAVCTACGHFAWSAFQIDQQCAERYNGTRCRGMNDASVNYRFKECPACGGTGNKCRRCLGHRLIAEKFEQTT